MRHPVVTHSSKHLKMKAQPVTIITDEIVQLPENIYGIMLAHDGTGLAAPQVGKGLQMTVIEIGEESGHFELINPVIIEKKRTSIDVGSCLSIPEIYGIVKRADEVTIRRFDREGEEMEVMIYSYLARAFRYKIGHLDGELLIDEVIEKIAPEDLEACMEEHFDD